MEQEPGELRPLDDNGRASQSQPEVDAAHSEGESLQLRAEELLEFPKIRAMLAGHTRFSLSRERALRIHPSWRREEVDRLQTETAEARLLLDTAGEIALGGMEDPRPLLARASLDGILTGEELVTGARALDAAYEARQAVRSMGRQVPLLADLVSAIADLRSTSSRIWEALTDRGQVRDSATPDLGAQRARVASGYNRLVQSLERVSGSQDIRPALQSSAIATRGNRLVLEVKIEHRKAVPGIVHDVSNTGATLFVEPFVSVDLCNQWREASAGAKREEEKVLRRLSAGLGDVHEEAARSMDAAAELDLIIARARLAHAMHAAPVEALDSGSDVAVDLIDARHPLLGDGAVPATVSIGPGFRALVITGPNAGGKTVALKTVGLLALMHQAGLQLPASGDSRMAVFDGVFADIGDAQSIELSISTFSSHLGAVVRILEQAGPGSLVLLDELGTGTDPEEGSALARAIVGEFVARDVPILATTHHRAVAEYAGRSDGVENASMELDPDTMRPTYHLVMGLPGRSYAISVARHLGLPDPVLDAAEKLTGAGRSDAEALLKQLQEERRKLAEVASSAEQERSRAEETRRLLESQLADIGRRQDDIVEETRRDLRREAEELRRSLRDIEREARLEGHHAAARRAADQARRRLRDPGWLEASRPVVPRPAPDADAAPSPVDESLTPGDVVELKGLGTRAEVRAVYDDGSVELLIGSATARIHINELRRLEGVKVPEPEREGYRLRSDARPDWTNEIDLRGMRAHEVHDAVSAFLDQCLLNGVTNARIIHGHGTGALREAVRETLAGSPSAGAFHPASREEGGDGVTIVELT